MESRQRFAANVGDPVECYHDLEPEKALWDAVVTVKYRWKFTVKKFDGAERHFNLYGEHLDPRHGVTGLRIRLKNSRGEGS